MFEYIKGTLEYISTDYIVVESNNIGFKILTCPGCIPNVSMHDTVKIYTYMHVREDDISLFGFMDQSSVALFKMLISISGIGPKGALSILSVLSIDELRLAVMSEDYKAIAKANGIGTKTAQKIVIELKDKLKIEDIYDNSDITAEDTTDFSNDNISETVLALTSLGYSNIEALKAVKKVKKADTMNVETLLKAALKNMM